MKRLTRISCLSIIVGWILGGGSVTHISRSDALTRRLAVLELQGDVGNLAQRQAWGDTIRAGALKALKAYGIHVIDRDQLSQLIDPKRDLSDCIGMCAAEIAREVNAQWSLSGSLVAIEREHNKSADEVTKPKAPTIIITLKLHSTSGELLGVEQRHDAHTPQAELLHAMTQKLLTRALHLDPSVSLRRDHDDRDASPQNDQSPRRPTNQPREQAHSSPKYNPQVSQAVSPRWVGLGRHDNQIKCMSPLVTQEQYQRCVLAGVCTPPAKWGRCATEPTDFVRCVHVKQALQFARWSGGWLPSVATWKAWAERARGHVTSKLPYEWLTPHGQTQRHEAQWRAHHLDIPLQRLRVASPITAYRLNTQSHRRHIYTTRRAPLAFAVTDLSFRVIYLTSHCPPQKWPSAQ